MEVGSKLYLKKNTNVYAKIISEVNVNKIPHFNILIFRGDSKTEGCLSKYALDLFYQDTPNKKINFFKNIFNHVKKFT